jgi:hypothetical protein
VAERILNGAGVRVVHMLRCLDGKPVCGTPEKSIVGTYAKVTCRNCERMRDSELAARRARMKSVKAAAHPTPKEK